MTEQGKAPAARTVCEICGQETSNDPGDFGTRCLRFRMGSPSTAGMVCFRIGYERLARQAVAPSKERHCIAALVAALKNVLGLADVDGGKHPWQARIVRDAVEALLDAYEIIGQPGEPQVSASKTPEQALEIPAIPGSKG